MILIDKACLDTLIQAVDMVCQARQLRRQRNGVMIAIIGLSVSTGLFLYRPPASQWTMVIVLLCDFSACLVLLYLRGRYNAVSKQLQQLGKQVEIIRELTSLSGNSNQPTLQKQINELLHLLPIFPKVD